MLTFQTLGALEVTDSGEPVRIGGRASAGSSPCC